jgi:uncharacterized protein YkwD
MRASSASGRGASRTTRGPAKVVRMPVAGKLRHQQMMRTWMITIIAAVVALGFAVRFERPQIRQASAMEPASTQFGAAEAHLLAMINDARKQAGRDALSLSDKLLIAARTHSQDMAAHLYLAHEGGAGDAPADRISATGLDYVEIAENLFSDGSSDLNALPARALSYWMASPTPRGNLLSPEFRSAAVAIARAVDGSLFVTLDLMH